MVTKPRLPDGFELPDTVNGWILDPESKRNAHVWTAADAPKSVGVFASVGDCVRACVFDDRVDGFENNEVLFRFEYDSDDVDDALAAEADAVREGIDRALAWMDSTPPAAWSHPDVCEAVFDAPPGYELDRYYLEDRETIVYYRRVGGETVVSLDGDFRRCTPEELTAENAPYLYVHTWNGSGKATVALAPWLRAHGPGSKHPEIREIADPPEDCGLEIAVTVARRWAQEQVGGEIDADAAGQSDLARWSA